ncbi:MAG: potassium-transporting ATPase subunit F [Chloroflexi bacterium]|nr:potassium-transporting ATPase subunit F [Chloroflexota bacterium]
MAPGMVFLLIAIFFTLAYLVFALLRPERF